jgi:hypothetical protein
MYSPDPKANRENSETPSPLISLHEQLIYKIASLDAAVQQGFRRLDERMDRMQTDLHDNQINFNDRLVRLESDIDSRFMVKRTRLDNLEKDFREFKGAVATNDRVTALERWRDIATARVAAVGGVFIIIWAIISKPVENFMGNLF